MGIKNFLVNFKCVSFNTVNEYNNIYIDGNYLLYNLINKCNNDNDLKEKVNSFVYNFFNKVIIKNKLYIIFDGLFDNENDVINPKLFKEKKYIVSDDYDKQPIKPKTEIVKKFKDLLEKSFKNMKTMYLQSFVIIIDDDYNLGEGDIKILNHINNNNSMIDKKTNKSLNIDNCIVSKDSDMILISSSLCLNNKINIDIINDPHKLFLIKYEEFYEKYEFDFILIILFLGNDYLPKLSNVDFEVLIECYESYKKIFGKNIINKKTIDNILFKEFIFILIYKLKNNKNKKLKFSLKVMNCKRFNIYINNIQWCLKIYNVLNNSNKYIVDKIGDKVINIYNLLFFNKKNYML